MNTLGVQTINTEPISNVPALTSIFTPSEKCLSRWFAYDYNSTTYAYSMSDFDPDYTSCLPLQAGGTYSPGVCPSGQTIAAFSEYRVAGSGTTSTVWRASCCNSGFELSTKYGTTIVCESTISTTTTAIIASSVVVTATYPTYTTELVQSRLACYTGRRGCSTTVLTQGIFYADMVVVFWQATDLSLFPASYASSIATLAGLIFTASPGPSTAGVPETGATSASSADSDSIADATEVPAPSKSANNSLAPGAIAGVVIGAVIGAILLGIGILLALRRRKRKEAVALQRHSQYDSYGWQTQQENYAPSRRSVWSDFWSRKLRLSTVPSDPPVVEIAGNPVQQISKDPAELEARPPRVELADN